MGRKHFDINCSKILFDPPSRVMKIKTKKNKWDLLKLKSFCTAKETINKMKRQPSEWEKIIANEATGKGLISKIHKQLMQFNIREANRKIKTNTVYHLIYMEFKKMVMITLYAKQKKRHRDTE